MFLECTCQNISLAEWEKLMKGKKPLNYKWLINKIKRDLPNTYKALALDLPNPWEDQCYRTKTHYVLTHTAIEYFFKK